MSDCICHVHGEGPHQLFCCACFDALRAERDGFLAALATAEALLAHVDELKALLREARLGVKNSAVQFGYPYTEYVDRIDDFLAPDSADVDDGGPYFGVADQPTVAQENGE